MKVECQADEVSEHSRDSKNSDGKVVITIVTPKKEQSEVSEVECLAAGTVVVKCSKNKKKRKRKGSSDVEENFYTPSCKKQE